MLSGVVIDKREVRRVALLAETLVEEWLNRQGYFTVRGVKGGVTADFSVIDPYRMMRTGGPPERLLSTDRACMVCAGQYQRNPLSKPNILGFEKPPIHREHL